MHRVCLTLYTTGCLLTLTTSSQEGNLWRTAWQRLLLHLTAGRVETYDLLIMLTTSCSPMLYQLRHTVRIYLFHNSLFLNLILMFLLTCIQNMKDTIKMAIKHQNIIADSLFQKYFKRRADTLTEQIPVFQNLDYT